MTLSTSASEGRALVWAVCLCLALVFVGLASLWTWGRWGAGAGPPIFEEALSAGPVDAVVLGNSVTRAAIDADALVGGRAVSLAMQGSQPAHWVAALRHQVGPAGVRPRHVVLYVPLQMLTHGALVSAVDKELFVGLLTRPDPELTPLALGAESVWAPWLRSRGRARSALLDGIGPALARSMVGAGELERARAALGDLPASPNSRATLVPGAPSAGAVAQREPERVDIASGFLPLLLAETNALGATLWVVEPAVRPSDRTPAGGRRPVATQAVVDAVLSGGGRVIDLSRAALPGARFETRYHPDPAGKTQITGQIDAVLAVADRSGGR